MTWGNENLGTGGLGDLGIGAPATGKVEAIELVGTHLRLNGQILLGRFNRLSDYINSSGGYVRVQNARLLRRNGDPTTLVLPELMIDQDEISFIAQADPDDVGLRDPSGGAIRSETIAEPDDGEPDVWAGLPAPTIRTQAPGGGDVWGRPGALGGGASTDRPERQFVMFTPGHTVSGFVKVFGGTDLTGFVDAKEPRFVPVNDVTARSLADRRIISHFKFVLLNRTHMIAASEIGRGGDPKHEDLPEL